MRLHPSFAPARPLFRSLFCSLLPILMPLALGACGGGGSSDAPSAPTSQAASAGGLSTAHCALPDFQASAMARINQKRAAGASCGARGSFAAAAPLAWNSLLTQAADGHSRDMAANNFHDHVSFDGRTLADRIDATGYAWSNIGENIAAGYAGVNAVVDGWMASDGHCANLMNPAFTEVGLACMSGNAATTYSSYWTMTLARPR
jgi:uncharacterized protein YkwD